MKGYISKNATLQECFDFLQADGAERHPMYDEIRMQYDSELKKWQDADNQLSAHCYTIDDCKMYLAKFCKVHYYSPLHKQKVMDRYEDLFWAKNWMTDTGKVEYLKLFPQGKHVKEIENLNSNHYLAIGCCAIGVIGLFVLLAILL